MPLNVKPQSSFRTVGSVADLIASEVDAIHWVDAPDATERGFLQDTGRGACIYKLHDAVYYPGKALRGEGVRAAAPNYPRLADGLKFKEDPASLVLTEASALFPESFLRSVFVPPALRWDDAESGFAADLPEVAEKLAGPSFYFELVTDHFGHALVDMPGRYWPLCLPTAPAFSSMRLVGQGLHGLRGGVSAAVPGFLSDLMAACGIALPRMTCLRAPVRFQELYVPSRIAPYCGRSGPMFGTLMQAVARHIAPDAAATGSARIYLSRSRLGAGYRSLGGDTETRLEALFAARGFEIVHPQELPFAEQVATMRGAGWLAGLVGSQLHLAVFCAAAQPRMFRIRPAFFPNWTDFNVLRTLGGTLHDFVVEADGPPIGEGASARPDKRAWNMTPSDLDRLDNEVTRWLAA